MEKVLLCIITASGLYAASSHAERQYHFVYEPKTMTEARSYCRERHTDLATIDNMEDVELLNKMAHLNKMVNSEDSYNAWIGLYDDLDSWRWSLSDKSFNKHGEAEFRRWSPGEPNNKNSGELCTWMYDNGLWSDHICEEQMSAVCVDVRGLNGTFVVTKKSMTWTEAQSYCREHHTDLASVRNMAENQKVNELVPTGQTAWIGLSRDSWKWLDGSNSSFRYWNNDTKEPNNNVGAEACVAIDFNRFGRWADWKCDIKRAFICYSEVPVSKQVMRVRLVNKHSSLDLNGRAVMEDILKQLKQRLKDHGVNEDIKLSWKKQSDGKVFHKDEEETNKRKTSTKKEEL
ncbi:macrophage mannose receptor 1-like [Enoplosus armatus]|uniref:macrophage mannose receptor 1-like n=1 Tax=Enoplosus armatus TaxID=215367 RepID=UPI0039915038